MQTKMQFSQNASVFTANGEAVGHLDRVVVAPPTKEISHIVVRKGFLFHEDKVVPLEMIIQATEDQITLRPDAGDLHTLPPFTETHYVMSKEAEAPTPLAGYVPTGYGLPPKAPGESPVPPVEKPIAQIEQNIPEGSVALKEGAKVVTADGESVGHIESIFADLPVKRATHLLIAEGMFMPEKRQIPMTWVDMIGEDEVHLTVEKPALEAVSAIKS